MIYGWTPGIGDPGAFGWLTVLAYFIAAMLCALAGRRNAPADRVGRRYWWTLAALLGALGVNKQLDLQSLLTVVARHAAETEGWYDVRRKAQTAFILLCATGAGVSVWALLTLLRGRGAAIRIAGVGCAMLIAFVLIRAASFHHLDMLLTTSELGIRATHVAELGAIGVIAFAAARALVEPLP